MSREADIQAEQLSVEINAWDEAVVEAAQRVIDTGDLTPPLANRMVRHLLTDLARQGLISRDGFPTQHGLDTRRVINALLQAAQNRVAEMEESS